MIKVSIIVPVHNAGNHLAKCLNSLIEQTLKDIEIILVLDVPTDGSDIICEEYAKKDNRIKLIRNKTNLHIGFSRNEGIKAAQGEYIGFTDHDDYCDRRMFEELYNAAKKENADVVVSNIYKESPKGRDYYSFPSGLPANVFNEKLLVSLISGNRSKKNTYSFDNGNPIWNKLYKRQFIEKHNILFSDNKKLTIEDVIFNIKVHFFCKKAYFLPETFYHHVNHEKNTFGSYDYLAISKTISHINEIFYFLKENNAWIQYKEMFAVSTVKRLYSSFLNEIKFKNISHSFSVSIFKEIKNNQDIQDILSVFDSNKKLIKKLAITKMIFLLIVKKRQKH